MKQKLEMAPIDITDKAVEKVKEIMKKEKKEDMCLRVGVMPGGCSGFVYDMSFDKQGDHDLVLEKDGLKVLVAKEVSSYLKGLRVDYVETLHESGFKIENPNANSTCGCGSSFS